MTLNNGSVSTPIFAGNNNDNIIDISSPPSFLLARDPYADAYEMHGHADITYVVSRGGERSPRNKACDTPICVLVFRLAALIQAPFITSHYLPRQVRMYVFLTDIANILKVRLVYIIWLHISVRIPLLQSAAQTRIRT